MSKVLTFLTKTMLNAMTALLLIFAWNVLAYTANEGEDDG